MLKLFAGSLLAAVGNVGMSGERMGIIRNQLQGSSSPAATSSERHIFVLRASVSQIHDAAETLGMPATRGAAVSCLDAIDGLQRCQEGFWIEQNDANAMVLACHGLTSAFAHEMGARSVFALSSENASLVNDPGPLFGQAVADAFPLAAEDISEAGKCLGLGRHTAAVFHLMRSMEVAVQALASALGVVNIERAWGVLLSDMRTAIEALPKGARRVQFSEAASNLYHVKEAWRNDTMHPKKTYTEEEATAVYRAVQSFMTHLALLVS
jgi:HEPN domain-containing protein